MLNNEQNHNLKNATIMIVDDEPINIDVVQVFLEEYGYTRFITVSDSTQALATIEKSKPDLLLLDLMMPDVSGFDILKAVRAHSKFSYLPIIILTAATDTENKLKALDLGATDFLAKPLDQSELGLRVRNNLAAKAYQDQLAYYDPLTNLPNRQLFVEELAWALTSAKRHDDEVAILNVGIDNFNKINDTLGINAGDEILRLVGQRIETVVRSSDLLSHAGSHENIELKLFHFDRGVFSLLLSRMKGAENAAIVAARILRKIKLPMQVEDRETNLTASIGLTTYPAESADPLNLWRLASSAKDYANKQGGDRFLFSSQTISEMYGKRLRLEGNLRRAVKEEEFVLYYQPKVAVKTGAILGVEALVRWNGPEGFVSPADFIPLAEETGLIIPLGEWILWKACRQLKKWHQVDNIPINMSYNLSVGQLADPNFLARMKGIIFKSGIDPQFLTIEITESLLIDNVDQKIELLHDLKRIGVRLSIDDFGTGYSSFSYLRQLPVDEIKIDRSFISEITSYKESQAIIAAIIVLAQGLNMETVAEGIEKKEELKFLQQHNCDQFQGFIFSPAISADKFAALYRSKK